MLLVSQSFMLIIIYTSGQQMFTDVLGRVSQANFRFYDVTPVGRLMNRMTSDLGTIDGNISQQLQEVAWLSITWLSSLVIIASVTPIFLIFSLALSVRTSFRSFPLPSPVLLCCMRYVAGRFRTSITSWCPSANPSFETAD